MKKQVFNSIEETLIPENMISLYAMGAFPMGEDDGSVNWYFPQVRTIIPLDNYNIPRSLNSFLKTAEFEYTFSEDYLAVIKGCASRDKTWINEEIMEAYKGLYKLGYLHSVEVRVKGELVGGLYGVAYKGAFFGESMFSRAPQSSKAALKTLLERLSARGYILLDVQYMTPHLKMFGAVELPLQKFQSLLKKSRELERSFL
ncbi:MAG TPA: leucyl/phenylalanyl-tRNA--protein transferase [Ignavibacteriales bacterium]|nr:leucyl/phenylalanyl-tRNA--protein transferase [Ignavibacteriales bacterium]